MGKAKEVPAGKKARVLHCSSPASFSFLWYKGNKKLCFCVQALLGTQMSQEEGEDRGRCWPGLQASLLVTDRCPGLDSYDWFCGCDRRLFIQHRQVRPWAVGSHLVCGALSPSPDLAVLTPPWPPATDSACAPARPPGAQGPAHRCRVQGSACWRSARGGQGVARPRAPRVPLTWNGAL